MRRFIAYLTMALAMILCVGAAVTPVFSRMNPGREYTTGHEIVYKLEDKEEPAEGVLPLDSNENAAKDVADEIKNRLDNMFVEDYSVKVQGNDTISVNFSTNDDTQFNYIAKYLGFNGGDFSLSGKNEETRVTKDKIFKDVTAYIYRDQSTIPYVIFPVSDPEPVKTLIDAVSGKTEKDPESRINPKRANEDGTTDGDDSSSEPDIFMWANWVEGDSYEKAEADPAVTGTKILCSFLSSKIWSEFSDEEETELAFLCGFGDAEGNYDAKKLEQANQMASYICNMFNASTFDYEVSYLFANQSSTGVEYQSVTTQPAAEFLIVLGSDKNIAISYTFIASMVAIVVGALLLVMFFRMPAIGVIANTSTTVLLTYLIFVSMGATFNIAAVVGGLLISLTSAFTAIAYLTKFKEEVYKGRTLRKANQEASKKSNLLTIDVAVITAFAGLMVYALGGASLRPLGIILFFGAIVALLMDLIVFKFLMYLLTNTTSLQTKYSYFNIDEKMVPNVMDEEKPTYVAPYEKVNFAKAKKPVGIIALLLTVASVVVISVFGAINGSPLNTKAATQDTTVVYTSIRADKVTIDSEDAFKNYVLKNINVDDKALSYDDNGVHMSSRVEYDYETSVSTTYHYFVLNLNSVIGESNKVTYKDGSTYVPALDLADAVYNLVESVEGAESSDYINVDQKVSSETVNVINQGFVALAAGLLIVGVALYCSLRYRPSRGVATLLTSAAATTITYGIFVAARIGTSAFTSIALPAVALLSLVTTLFILNKEKDLIKDEKGEIDLARREEISKRAVGISAASVLFFLVLAAFVAIDFFGFVRVDNFSGIFGSILLGVVIIGFVVLILQGPLSTSLAKLFAKIKMPKIKHKSNSDKIKLQAKPKTSEPEERIFIGIND